MSEINTSFILLQMEVGPMQNFTYLVGSQSSREVLVVDPGWEPDTISKAVEEGGLKLAGALITHTHFDHVNALDGILKKYDIPVYIHEAESQFLKNCENNIRKVRGEDTLVIGDVTIRFLHTPGHTPGSQCFLVQNHLVSGDTLFINYCGRCDLPGGNIEEMYKSLARLRELDDRIVLCPGHHYSKTKKAVLGDQKKDNPYLACESLPRFLRAMGGLLDG